MCFLVVYRDMKEEFLADESDHGIRELREIFKGTNECSG